MRRRICSASVRRNAGLTHRFASMRMTSAISCGHSVRMVPSAMPSRMIGSTNCGATSLMIDWYCMPKKRLLRTGSGAIATSALRGSCGPSIEASNSACIFSRPVMRGSSRISTSSRMSGSLSRSMAALRMSSFDLKWWYTAPFVTSS